MSDDQIHALRDVVNQKAQPLKSISCPPEEYQRWVKSELLQLRSTVPTFKLEDE